jgi:hypothetical protein
MRKKKGGGGAVSYTSFVAGYCGGRALLST